MNSNWMQQELLRQADEAGDLTAPTGSRTLAAEPGRGGTHGLLAGVLLTLMVIAAVLVLLG